MNYIDPVRAVELAKEFYAVEGTAELLPSEWGGTFCITAETGRQYLLKLAPHHVDTTRVQCEEAALTLLQTQSHAKFDVPELITSSLGTKLCTVEEGTLRLQTWLPGRTWATTNPHTKEMLFDLGAAMGELKQALADFDHPGAHFSFDWSPHEAAWLQESAVHNSDAAIDFGNVLADLSSADLNHLPHAVNYNDCNDHNVILNGTRIGFIDFGDMHFGPRINDLAICLSYFMQHHTDPVGAGCEVIRGYSTSFDLTESEISILLLLIKARLAISITKAHRRKAADPSNNYWQISVEGAVKLWEYVESSSDHLILCRFRCAAGLEPCPKSNVVQEWLMANSKAIHPVLGFFPGNSDTYVFDWSVGSAELGTMEDLSDVEEMTWHTFRNIKKRNAIIGVGRYDEPRAVYTSEEYAVPGFYCPEMRTIHIGIDVFARAGTPLYSPLDGVVSSITHDAGDKKYGPLLILEHTVQANLKFYTLYGHNSQASLQLFEKGDHVTKGQLIGYIGDFPENGNWVPHLHFQVITDLLDFVDDFPGVAPVSQRETWLSLSPDPNLVLQIDTSCTFVTHDTDAILSKRTNLLGPGLSLSYRKPLLIVRAHKSRLYDADGLSWLDTRNNIAHVGHENDRVVKAGQRQMGVLNTNTRYLHHQRLSLAAELLSTLPDNLKYIYFVNSGSEANDLALRMARQATQSTKTLVMNNGYHGHTELSLEVSHYKFGGKGGGGQAENIFILPPLSGSVQEADEALLAYSSINPEGAPITFIHEAMPSCAGQIIPPMDYYTGLYRAVRNGGGVCIADEIQTGLGRIGERFWAFEWYGLEPDIVTIGKPLGNGHPVAAVAVSAEVAHAFDTGMEFFSSFGGNPVSCAIAAEVLAVLKDEELQEHARLTGELWKSQLRQISAHHEVIRDIRGHGLFLGIEFADRGDAPVSKVADYIKQRMYDHRILTSFDGPHENVMKLKPPMTFGGAEATYFTDILDKILREDPCRV